MMECTDRHFRYVARLCSAHALLYTEMISTGAIIHGHRDYILGFNARELPLALQIGGGDPDACARAVALSEPYGYSEYNLNVGCPSPRVRSGCFGAALMMEPARVANIVRAMRAETDKVVTVKHRLGVGKEFSYDALRNFAEQVIDGGAARLIVHARTAILDGLTPKQNRHIPPICYDAVYRLKEDFPHIPIEINGHIESVASIRDHLQQVDGVMLGRVVYNNLLLLADVEREIFSDGLEAAHARDGSTRACAASGENTVNIEGELPVGWLIDGIIAYLSSPEEHGAPPPHPHRMMSHLAGLFYRRAGARQWRRVLQREISAHRPLRMAIATAYRALCETRMSAGI